MKFFNEVNSHSNRVAKNTHAQPCTKSVNAKKFVRNRGLVVEFASVMKSYIRDLLIL